MQPRSLDAIISELNGTYQPQIDSIRQRQSMIPGAIQAEEQGLQAQQGQAFDDIMGGARRRGMGFSGIPLQEQAKYTSTQFLPAMARLRQSGREQAMSLEDAILGINERRNTSALGIRQNEQQMAEQQRQFNASHALQQQQLAAQQRAASASAYRPAATIGSLGSPTQSLVTQRKDKGYEFKDQFGNPISAAAYAAATGVPFRQLLQTMANSGDTGAGTALGFVGDDFGYDKRKIGNNQSLYNALTWGIR